MDRHSRIQEYLHNLLPGGVFAHVQRPKAKTRIIFTDLYDSVNYYEFYVNMLQSDEALFLELSIETQKFLKLWNSPLMKALR